MSTSILTALIATLALSGSVKADISTITSAPAATHTLNARQSATTKETASALPLTDYFYNYTDIPYQVNPYTSGRGPQSGYNRRNSTTEGPDSLCQTAVINSIDDFCLWGAPGLSSNQSIGDVEAAVVAYCTRSGHGSRIFPPGTFTAVQVSLDRALSPHPTFNPYVVSRSANADVARFMKTPAYIQVVGLFNQSAINLATDDGGGELDPHGADLAGNPLGGLVYSTGFPSGNNSTYQQTESWNNFIGSGQFCFKLCDPAYNTTANYCQNIYDLLGCKYNMPAAYAPGAFLSCEGELQATPQTERVGVSLKLSDIESLTSSAYTWSQPSALPASSTLPWTPRIPASSNCVTYQSADLFPASALGYQNASAPAASNTASATSSAGAMGVVT